MAQGEKNSIAQLFAGTSVGLFFLGLLLNVRIYTQVMGVTLNEVLEIFASSIFKGVVLLFSFAGYKYVMLIIALLIVLLFFVYVLVGKPGASDKRPAGYHYVLCTLALILFFVSIIFSPFQRTIQGETINSFTFYLYLGINLTSYIVFIGTIGTIGKWLVISGKGSIKDSIDKDPFGKKERLFQQTTELIENEYSVNIPYEFYNFDGKLTPGFQNFINIFRAVLILGTPGSGKSFVYFLAMIDQLSTKGFTFCNYDFKYPDLATYQYNCYLRDQDVYLKKYGKVPEFNVFSPDKLWESNRINVFQPHLLEDFTLHAYGLASIFLNALNRSWSTKEGDFFPESAKNFAAAGIWILKLYKNGKNCTLPHLIEFLSMDIESIIKILIMFKDYSLSNVVKPFEEALLSEAVEQLQGQIGTVRIALSRLSSPITYWLLTEDSNDNRFSLALNNPEEPKILILGNSAENQMVNNIYHSLMLSQISRFINKKGKLPISLGLDEFTTLSFPKSTIDTLIQTGRSNLISVWLGTQDAKLMERDLGKEVAGAIINMVGNTVSGEVKNETADMMQKTIGKVRVYKKSMSVSSDGTPSYSFSESMDYAVPDYMLASLSQGEFAGKLADNVDQKLAIKVFYGAAKYKPAFHELDEKTGKFRANYPSQIPVTKYWQETFKVNNCTTEEERKNLTSRIMNENFERVVKDIQKMKEDILDN